VPKTVKRKRGSKFISVLTPHNGPLLHKKGASHITEWPSRCKTANCCCFLCPRPCSDKYYENCRRCFKKASSDILQLQSSVTPCRGLDLECYYAVPRTSQDFLGSRACRPAVTATVHFTHLSADQSCQVGLESPILIFVNVAANRSGDGLIS